MDTVHEEALAAAGTRPGGTIDLNAAMRSLLEGLLNALMDEQASETGAQRNGYRERSLDTCVGRVTLRIPKLRRGTYFPDDVVERWSRTDTALASAICEMWVGGVSTRKVEAAAELGVERMSRSRVSRLCASLDAKVDEMRGGDLSYSEWPYLWLGASYVPCREAGAARSTALAYLDFPGEHRAWVRTNNVQERMNREIKRRASVVQVFPSVASLLRLAGAVCCDQNDAWAVERNFIDRRTLEGPLAASSAAPTPEDPASVITLVEEALDRKLRTPPPSGDGHPRGRRRYTTFRDTTMANLGSSGSRLVWPQI